MKALSIHPYYVLAIMAEEKTIEWRSWSTKYRGDLLICSTAHKVKGTIPGHALAVMTLVDVVPFEKKHLEAAYMDTMPDPAGYAWILDNYRDIVPQPVKGKLGLWEYTGDIIYIPEADTEEEDMENYNKYLKPLFI